MKNFKAQETRRTVVHATRNPALDTQPNSAQVPDVYAESVQVRRIVLLRFKHDTDLLAGLQKMIQQEKIRNAVILSGFGSVRSYHVHQVDNRDFPPRDVFVKHPAAPADINNMSGLVKDGKVHAHITLADAEKAFGGHLEPDTRVFTFAVVVLGVLDDGLDLTKLDDWTYR